VGQSETLVTEVTPTVDFRKTARQFTQESPIFPQKSPTFPKKSLIFSQKSRTLWIVVCNRAKLSVLRQTLGSAPKHAHVSTNAKEPYISAKQLYMSAEKPHIEQLV